MPKTPTTAPEVDAPEEALLISSEVDTFKKHFANTDSLVKAEDAHNLSGLDTIEMFEATRKRIVDAKICLAKDAPLKVHTSIIALLNTMELEERVEKRIKSEMKSVFSYFENSLSIRFRALTFTVFAKIVKLYDENSETMTKSKIKALLSVFKKINDDSTKAQIDDADKKYALKAKNLIILVEAMNLAGEYDADSVPTGFAAIFQMAKGLDKKVINNMINGLRVASNEKEDVYKAS